MHKFTSGSRAAGVSPPWLGHTIGVPREANVVQRGANTQPRAAGVSPPWICEYRTCNAAATKSRQTAEGVCADRRCIRVERRRKGLTLVPAPALRDFQSLCSRAGLPRGAYAPRSCIAARTLVGENTIFAMHECTLAQEQRSSARRGSVIRSVCREKRMLFSDERTHSQEQRSSAHRGYRYRTCKGASTKSRRTAEGVCADRRCIRVDSCHGGLTPPALGCTHGYRRRFTVAIRKDVLFHTGSLRSPLLCCNAKVPRREAGRGYNRTVGALMRMSRVSGGVKVSGATLPTRSVSRVPDGSAISSRRMPSRSWSLACTV